MIVTRFLKAQAVVVVDDNLLEVLMMMVIQVIVMVRKFGQTRGLFRYCRSEFIISMFLNFFSTLVSLLYTMCTTHVLSMSTYHSK